MHWTQKPENRAKVIAMSKRAAATRKKKPVGRPIGRRHTKAARARISAAMKASHEAKTSRVNGTMALHLNGHALTPPIPITGKRLAKAAVTRLAAEGARARLVHLEHEIEVLRIFIKAVEE